MTRLEEITTRHKQLSSELDKYKDSDPERLKEVRECAVYFLKWRYHWCLITVGKETTVAMDAANRWTGNKIVFNYCLSNT